MVAKIREREGEHGGMIAMPDALHGFHLLSCIAFSYLQDSITPVFVDVIHHAQVASFGQAVQQVSLKHFPRMS